MGDEIVTRVAWVLRGVWVSELGGWCERWVGHERWEGGVRGGVSGVRGGWCMGGVV